MADRFPIIIESTEQQIQELSAGDGLDLTKSGVVNANYVHSAGVNAGVVTATSFIGDGSQITNIPAGGGSLEATASGTLSDGSKVIVNTDGTVSAVGFSTIPKNWITTLGGSSTDETWDITVDSSGNVYLAGLNYITYSSAGVAKLNSSSDIQWSSYANPGSNSTTYFYGVFVDGSGNVYTGGVTDSDNNAILFKYNSSGVLQWKKSLGTSSSAEYITGIASDSYGNIYAAGYFEGRPALIKLDSSGNTIWKRKWNQSGRTDGRIVIDSSDNIYVFGWTNAVGQGGLDFLLLKWNSSGTIQWERTLGASGSDRGYDMAIDSSDNLFVIGRHTDGSDYDSVIAKYDNSGNLVWQRQLGGSGSDSYYDGIAVDNSGNVYICQYNDGDGITVAKYDNDGNIQWQNSLDNSTGTDYPKGIAVDPDGSNVYVTGHGDVTGKGSEWIVAKLSGDGTGTGTYGTFTYATSSKTDAAGTLTSASHSQGSSNFTLSNSTSSLTEYSGSLTSSTNVVSYDTNLTSENFIGISNGAYSDGQTATIQIAGSVDDAQSSLTPGQQYYVQGDGTLSETADSPSVLAGTAVAATKLMIG